MYILTQKGATYIVGAPEEDKAIALARANHEALSSNKEVEVWVKVGVIRPVRSTVFEGNG